MKQNKLLSSILVLTGTLVLSSLPAWSQTRPEGGSSGGTGPGGTVTPGGRGTIPEEMKGQKEVGSGDEIKKLQEALKQKGHYTGPIDGVMGSSTRDAVMAFQKSQGLSATGTADDQTKKALGLPSEGKPKADSKPEVQPQAPKTKGPLDQPDVSTRG